MKTSQKQKDRRIYITHCSAKKSCILRGKSKMVPPEELYTSVRIQRFIRICKSEKVSWAIFSDLYGIVFPADKISWYEKHPSKVSQGEFQFLVCDFDEKLNKYNQIWFYHHPARFHQLYKKVIEKTALSERITLFRKINEIIPSQVQKLKS